MQRKSEKTAEKKDEDAESNDDIVLTSNIKWDDENWHSFSAVKRKRPNDENYNYELYFDGKLVDSENKAGQSILPQYIDNIGIGFGNTGFLGYEKYFNGLIEEVRLYDRALSQEEIQSLQHWKPDFVRQRIFVGSNDYYFRLIEPGTGLTVENFEGQQLESGLDPEEAGKETEQVAIRRPVTHNGGAAIAELIVYREE